MSKRRMSSMATNSGGTLHAGVLAQHNAAVQKARLLEEHVKRKEQAKKPKRTMDYFFKKSSNQTAKGLTAFYLVVTGKKVNTQTIQDNYGIGLSTLQRYKTWYGNGKFDGIEKKINNFVLDNKEELIEVINKSPALTIKESKRLYELARPVGFNIQTGKVPPSKLKPKKEDTIKDYDHMLSKEQKVELMDLANLELSEVKLITKADVIVGVITGVIVGGAMVAYAFLTNGAI